jgi:guanylate kinase
MSIVFIISAPSGSGKSTLVNQVRMVVPELDFSVSYTTRKPRGDERNGKEYYFISRPEFEEMVKRDEFLEHADVFGNCYGTARSFLHRAKERDSDLLLDIDVQGAEQIKKKIPEAVSIFILPPDRRTLEERLRKRGQDSDHVIRRRLDTARQEIENYDKYDYILVNDRLEDSVEALQAIVLAERFQHSGATLSADQSRRFAMAERYRLKNVRERVRPILQSFGSNSGRAIGFEAEPERADCSGEKTS